jgi:hypothetical protein
MPQDMVSLDIERARTDDLLRPIGSTYVPLAVAAALTFHQAHGSTKAIVSRQDYEDALGIAAAALSRLIPIYTLKDPREGRVVITVDLLKQRFERGATELRARDGTAVQELSIQRSDLESAIALVKDAGLPFSFALEAAPSAQARFDAHQGVPAREA